MNQLTQEQIKTLEDAFASYPEKYRNKKGKYRSMEGIQEQLDELGENIGVILYVSKMTTMDNGEIDCEIKKMLPGEKL